MLGKERHDVGLVHLIWKLTGSFFLTVTFLTVTALYSPSVTKGVPPCNLWHGDADVQRVLSLSEAAPVRCCLS